MNVKKMKVRRYQISENFNLKEFACKDGSKDLLIDIDLVRDLQRLRKLIQTPININSGYRTLTYNKAVGGVSNSFHTKGRAFDISTDVNLFTCLKALELLDVKGILYYPNSHFIHMDSRDHYLRCYEQPKYNLVSTWLDKNTILRVQTYLNKSGFDCGKLDGIAGARTKSAFIKFIDEAEPKLYRNMIIKLGGY